MFQEVLRSEFLMKINAPSNEPRAINSRTQYKFQDKYFMPVFPVFRTNNFFTKLGIISQCTESVASCLDFEKDLDRCFKYLLQSQQDLERTKLHAS